MKPFCSSNRRCYRTSCEPCAWRHSLNISRRILNTDLRRLFAVTFAPTHAARTNFRSWRIKVRNLVDYRRRECRWWWDVGLWCWLGADGCVRGIASLGSITEGEFVGAFGWRWPTALRSIDHQELRNEVYFAMRPGIIAHPKPTGRYQSVRFVVAPRTHRRRPVVASGWTEFPSSQPIPVLL